VDRPAIGTLRHGIIAEGGRETRFQEARAHGGIENLRLTTDGTFDLAEQEWCTAHVLSTASDEELALIAGHSAPRLQHRREAGCAKVI
jgi:hypothetical protein